MEWGKTEETKKSLSTQNWLEAISENYLIYGESKVGKTYNVNWKILKELEKEQDITVFVINTDLGFADSAIQLGLDKYKDKIKYYQVKDIRDSINAVEEISKIAKPNDILVYDLYSQVWKDSQNEFLSQIAGADIVNFIERAQTDSSKFGLFSGNQWIYIKKLDELVTSHLTKKAKCRIFAITDSKDVSMEYTMDKTKRKDVWFDVGRPEGRKDAMYLFSNIIKIRKNGKGDREFMVVGTRKQDADYTWVQFNTPEEFWTKLEKIVK